MDVYGAYKIAVDSGDLEQLKAAFSKHWLITGIKPTLIKKELAFSNEFPEAYEMEEVDDWVAKAYAFSGKHSYEQLAVYIPTGTTLRLEYEEYKMKHAWLVDGKFGVDVMHSVPFIRSIPSIQNPMKNGFVHGVIYGCADVATELKSTDTSKLVPDLKFVVCYLINSNINNMSVSLETFRLLGFTVASHVSIAINKWDAVKKSASLALGSGAINYECYKILVMHDDYRIVDKLQGKDINRWGFVAYIKHPSILMEVKGIEWRTKIFEHKVVIIPYVSFLYNNEVIFNIDNSVFVKSPKNELVDMQTNYADIISGKYCIGDIMSVLIEDNKYVGITCEVKSKSGSNIPSGCPSCGCMLDVFQDKLICTNPKCIEIIKNTMNIWVGAYGPTIAGDLLVAFIKTYNISSIADIYTTFDKGVVTEERFGGLFVSMKDSRMQGLSKFLALICAKITDVEAERMCNFAKMNVQNLCAMSIVQLVEIVGMASDKAFDVVEWIERNETWFKCTLDAFIGIKINNSKLFGKTFVISGLLYERDKLSMEAKIRGMGGRVVDNGKNVDYIIVGQFADEGLLKRAQTAHFPPIVIRETSFQDFIKDSTMSA
jgi:hypothetical protein